MLIKSVHSAPSERLAVTNAPQKRIGLLYNLNRNARCSPHSRALRHHHGGFKWKRKYPIPPRHWIPAYMHNSRGVFVTRKLKKPWARVHRRWARIAKLSEEQRTRVRATQTYKKCTKPECASIEGKSRIRTEVSVRNAKNIERRMDENVVLRTLFRKIAASGAQRRTRPGVSWKYRGEGKV